MAYYFKPATNLGTTEIWYKNLEEIVKLCSTETYKKKKKKKKKKGKKDACYHKVKSRYKVWPSAYASGALVKCRKVGAKNWGNSKKESLQIVIEDELTQVLQERNGANVPVTGRQIANYWVDPADGLKHGYLNYVDALEQSEQGVQPPFQRVPNWLTPEIIKEHTQEIARQMSQDIKNVSAQTGRTWSTLVSSLNI